MDRSSDVPALSAYSYHCAGRGWDYRHLASTHSETGNQKVDNMQQFVVDQMLACMKFSLPCLLSAHPSGYNKHRFVVSVRYFCRSEAEHDYTVFVLVHFILGIFQTLEIKCVFKHHPIMIILN